MKKSLFTLAALATVMASCSDENVLVDNGQNQETPETAIGFGTFANKSTRAENSGESATLSLGYHHATFAVWGFKDVDKENYVFGTSTTAGQVVDGNLKDAEGVYTAQEAVAYNAALPGAVSTTTVKTPAVTYTQEDINDAQAIVAEGADGVNGYTHDDVDAAEAVVNAGVGAVKTAAVYYTANEAKKYNANLPGAVKANDFKGATYTWTYSPIRFWDKNSNRYDFYAAAPATTDATMPQWTLKGVAKNTLNAKNPQDGYFTLNKVVMADETLADDTYNQSMAGQGNIDYMIADEKHVDLADYSKEVEFDFNHILSRLNITVKRGANLNTLAAKDNGAHAADAKLEIVKLEVHNILSQGNFDESKAEGTTLSNGTITRWAKVAKPITYNGVPTDNITDKIYILQSLFIPQEVESKVTDRDGSDVDTKAYLYVEYKIGTDNGDVKAETFKAYYNLAAVFGVATGEKLAFNEGWQNTLNLTIDADAIVFTAQTYKWDDNKNEDFDIE